MTLGADLEYVLVEGPDRGTRRQLLVLVEPLVDAALARYGVATRVELGRANGAALERLKVAALDGPGPRRGTKTARRAGRKARRSAVG